VNPAEPTHWNTYETHYGITRVRQFGWVLG
jgi:hypothetical protein